MPDLSAVKRKWTTLAEKLSGPAWPKSLDQYDPKNDTMHRRLGNQWDIGQIMACLGLVASYQEDWNRARTCFEECSAVWLALGDPRHSHVLNNLATIAFKQGDLEGARAQFEESLRAQKQIGDRWILPRTMIRLGAVITE